MLLVVKLFASLFLLLFQLSVEHLDAIERIVSESVFVRYNHITNRFCCMSCLMFPFVVTITSLLFILIYIIGAAGQNQDGGQGTYTFVTITSTCFYSISPVLCCCWICCGRYSRCVGFIPKFDSMVSIVSKTM